MSDNIYKKLVDLQNELKAPKNQYNSFGKYKYRSAEDIIEAVKPLTQKYGLTMIISDTIENMGDRFYIKATVTLTDVETGDHVQATGFAREELTKKGMDGSQITGASSSYARKYALNGMFAIDDTKDTDTDEYVNERNNRAKRQTKQELANNYQVREIKTGYSKDELETMLTRLKVDSVEKLTREQAQKMVDHLKKSKPAKKELNINDI